MKVANIDLTQEVLVVAEIGNNHEGDFALAQDMIWSAAEAGVNAVKFQTIIPDRLVSSVEVARIAQLSRYAFTQDQFSELANIAQAAGLLFLSTPFSPDVVPWLDGLVPAFKIASGDNNFFPLLKAVARTGKPVLLSTGMTCMADVLTACDVIDQSSEAAGTPCEIALLHCVSAYPTPPEQANLQAITTLATTGRTVGYSDHTLGLEAAFLSVALGARIIEKHFTLSKTQSDFRDHALSADPAELAELVRLTRQAQAMLGSGEKTIQMAEVATEIAARRSIVARTDLPAGHIITDEDFDWLRPGGGLSPGEEHLLLGRRLLGAVSRGCMILEKMVA